MRRTAACIVAACLSFLFAVPSPAQQGGTRPNVLIVLHSSQTMPAAMQRFSQEYGSAACDCSLLREEDLTSERLLAARTVFFQHPTAEMLAGLKPAATTALKGGLQVATDVPEFVVRGWGAEPSAKLTAAVMPYFNNGGDENMYRMLLALFQAAGGRLHAPLPPPVQVANRGIYHPDAPRLFPDMASYLEWYRKAKPGQGALVTVNFFFTNLKDKDTAVVDALLRELERKGLAAAGVVGSPHASLAALFNPPANDPIRVMMMFTLALAKPEDRLLLEKQNVHVIDLMTTRNTRAEWEHMDKGVTPDRINSMLANPEASGATEPIMVGSTEGGGPGVPAHLEPIPERVHAAVARAQRWIVLAEKSNEQKRLALIYYNNPPGKGNIGASYLNLPPSIGAVLQTLRDAGYRTGDRVPGTDEILATLASVGHNVENWEPGELDTMVQHGGATLVPLAQYEQWFAELPEQFRSAVIARWGQPRDAKLMAWMSPAGKKFFVIPGRQFGNVWLGPQLLRSSFAEYTNVQHSATLPPHHGYIASFLFYRNTLKVDAMIQMGRHGTLEWLPGKNAGQAGWDTSEVLLGDLPNVNYYIMDGDGEAVQARRRGAAVLISHLTPMLVHTGFEERFGALNEALSRWQESHETAPSLAAEYAKTADAEIMRLGLDKQLNLDLGNESESMEKAIAFLDTVEESPMPLGLPTLGTAPSEDRERAGLQTFLSNGFMPDELKLVGNDLPSWTEDVFTGRPTALPNSLNDPLLTKVQNSLAESRTWIANLRISPGEELAALPRVLRGEYQPSGPVGDPLNVPEALPTGRDLHQGDPNLLPTKAAWALGQRMGDELLAHYKAQHGAYPDHISMVLWQGETGRNQGAMEAEAMYLMGVRPEWNNRNVVDHLSLIADDKMKHPRVNVVFTASGLYRDGLADKIIMLDRAARMAAAAGDNALSRQNRETTKALMAAGMGAEQAAEYAGARVFSNAPGSYGSGLSNMTEQSRDVDEHTTMADLYLAKTNYVYTEKSWGTTVPKLLVHQLRGNQVVMHSRSSNLYGAVDNDDVYQAMGGLRLASEAAGAKPDLMMNNLRHSGHESVQDARQFIAAELNARNWNPQWISEMQKEGYAGAREMTRAMENLYGWKATAPETVAPEVWRKMYDVYVKDEYSLGLKQSMQQANPAARQAMLGRLLEVDRQGTYRFSTQERAQMLQEYAKSVAASGLACTANTCGNPALKRELQQQIQRLPASALTGRERMQFRQEVKRVAAAPKPSAATPITTPALPHAKRLPATIGGMKVTYVHVASLLRSTKRLVEEHVVFIVGLWITTLILGFAAGLARRRYLQHDTLTMRLEAHRS